MVLQYPHKAKVFASGASAKDENGNWQTAEAELIFESDCRLEPAKANQYIVGLDGKQITLSAIVYMPRSATPIKPGVFFEVWDEEVLLTRETVKQFSKGQLNARVWL